MPNEKWRSLLNKMPAEMRNSDMKDILEAEEIDEKRNTLKGTGMKRLAFDSKERKAPNFKSEYAKIQ